jgi:hypothetical protein
VDASVLQAGLSHNPLVLIQVASLLSLLHGTLSSCSKLTYVVEVDGAGFF